MPEKETIGERIKRLRKEKGLTADDLAAAAGVNRATVFRYENSNTKKIPAQPLTAIAAALGVTVEQLVGWDYKQEPGDALRTIAAALRARETIAAATLGLSSEGVEVGRAYDESAPPIQTAVKKLLDITEQQPLIKPTSKEE